MHYDEHILHQVLAIRFWTAHGANPLRNLVEPARVDRAEGEGPRRLDALFFGQIHGHHRRAHVPGVALRCTILPLAVAMASE